MTEYILMLQAWALSARGQFSERLRRLGEDERNDAGFTLLEYVFGAVIIAGMVITIVTLLYNHFQAKATSVTQQ